MLRIERGAAGWEAWTLPLSYAAPHISLDTDHSNLQICHRNYWNDFKLDDSRKSLKGPEIKKRLGLNGIWKLEWGMTATKKALDHCLLKTLAKNNKKNEIKNGSELKLKRQDRLKWGFEEIKQ